MLGEMIIGMVPPVLVGFGCALVAAGVVMLIMGRGGS